MTNIFRIIFILIFIPLLAFAKNNILHASFDVTRELFCEINSNFEQQIKVLQSHGGSGKQTSAIVHGLKADIASLAMNYHMEILANKGLVDKDWQEQFPNNSSPMSTHIVFLVRKDNPKEIHDWQDLIKKDVKVIIGNPKTSGGALWNYVSAWIYATNTYKQKQQIEEFITGIYKNVPILDSTARNSAITFLKRNIGDVLITWESEAKYIINHINKDYKIIEPSISVKIDIPVAIISKSRNKELAKAYINFLYSKKGQEIIAKYYYHTAINPDNGQNLRKAEDFINWHQFKQNHFAEDGFFEKIY
jgi:sulfate/thiosulfate transport system substrate-binding protein